MNGICQTCGTVAPIAWFLNSAAERQINAILAELPKDVQGVVFHYLSLFRPVAGRALQARKATRLMLEVKELVMGGHIQIDKRVARPCPPRIWALAMEQMVERRDRLTIPMPNHKYLQTIAYDLADQADSKAEKASYSQQRQARTVNREATPQAISSPLDQYIQGLRDDKPTDEEMTAWKQSRLR